MRVIIVAALMLGGCAGSNYLVENYSGPALASYHFDYGRFNVWRHTAKNAFATQVFVGDAAAGGFIKGLTFGAATPFPPPVIHTQAADAIVAALVGRKCKVTRSNAVHETTIEHEYACDDGAPIQAAELVSAAEAFRPPTVQSRPDRDRRDGGR